MLIERRLAEAPYFKTEVADIRQSFAAMSRMKSCLPEYTGLYLLR